MRLSQNLSLRAHNTIGLLKVQPLNVIKIMVVMQDAAADWGFFHCQSLGFRPNEAFH